MNTEQINKIIYIIESCATQARDCSHMSLDNQTVYDIADEVKTYLNIINVSKKESSVSILEEHLKIMKDEIDCHINSWDDSDMVREKDMNFGRICGVEESISILKGELI